MSLGEKKQRDLNKKIELLDSDGLSRLPRSFFTRDGITVAKELLGKILVHETELGVVRGIITEVESYMGEEDKGSHTYGGRRTERTEPMYHIGGTSYVYLIYGMYSCMNITTAEAEVAQAVLLRSVVPADEESGKRMLALRVQEAMRKDARRREKGGTAGMTENEEAIRSTYVKRVLKHLADGPGKLCIAMGISRDDNDCDMVESDTFYVTEGIAVAENEIQIGKRIGIDYAEEAADYLWRFYL